jgi:NAD(P)H-flavin reductase
MPVTTPTKIDWTKNPHRGIQTEIARELGTSRQAVQAGLAVGNPRMVELATKKLEERKRLMERYANAAA